MESLSPLWWGQGMFLQPQHFQQYHLHHEARLQHALHLLHPWGWGVNVLRINEMALQTNLVEIAQCELITKEGTPLHFQQGSARSNMHLRGRSCDTALRQTGESTLGVYLGVRRWQPENNNVLDPDTPTGDEVSGSPARRFRVREQPALDLLTEDGLTRPVKYLMYDARVLFDTEREQFPDYEVLKIAEVRRSAREGGAELVRRYIPPLVRVDAAPDLMRMLGEVRDLLTAKGRDLEEFKRRRGIHTMDLGTRDTVYLLMLQAVNRSIPLWHHALEMAAAPPHLMYGLLRQLVGDLSMFSETVTALGGLPPYQHEHLRECFEVAVRTARGLVNELLIGPDYVVTLEFDGTYFMADIDERFFVGRNNRYYLAINADVSPDQLSNFLTSTGKIAARQDIEYLRTQAMFGLRITLEISLPAELPRRAHCHYFAIDHYDTLWTAGIADHHNMAVYCGDALAPERTQIQLLRVTDTR